MELTGIKLNQLKKASEAYKEQKAIYEDLITEDMETALPAWPEFRDAFLLDWNNNRTIVSDKEADEIFDKVAEEALAVIGDIEDVVPVVNTINQENEMSKKTELPPNTEMIGTELVGTNGHVVMGDVQPKRRRRVASKSAVKAKTKAVKAAKAKKVAKTDNGPSKMDLARATVEKFAAKDWSRKDILARLVEQNGLSPAYAATAYQKIRAAA